MSEPSAHRAWTTFGLSLAAGALFAALWPPLGWWWLSFVALVPLALAAIGARRAWVLALATFVGQVPAWIFLERWIFELTEFGAATLVVYCAGYVVLAALLLRVVLRSPSLRGMPCAIALPILWCAVEALRAKLILGGYPWFLLGFSVVGAPTSASPLAQAADLFGAASLSFPLAAVSGALVDLLRIRDGFPARRACVSAGVAGLLVAGQALYGARRLLDAPRSSTALATDGSLPALDVLAIQTNLSVSNKNAWEFEDQLRDVARFVKETRDAFAASDPPPDVVAWPETMLPGFGLEAATIETLVSGGYAPGSIFSDGIRGLQERLGVPLIVGSSVYLGLRADPESQRWKWDRHYNSAYLLADGEVAGRYDKLVLTPFGEEMPLISRWEWLEQSLLAISAPGMRFDLDSGERPVRFEVRARSVGADTQVRIATPICFEDTVGWACRDLAYEGGRKVADVLLNLSNDGWFGSDDAGRAQHLLHARLRAIELRTPMVRCANTGLSAAIDSSGRVTAWIGASAPGTGRVSGALRARVDLDPRETFYGGIGDAWPWLATSAGAILLLLSRRANGRAAPGEGSHPPSTAQGSRV